MPQTTRPTAPILINTINGKHVVTCVADVIEDAIATGSPLTVTGPRCAGDVVTIRPQLIAGRGADGAWGHREVVNAREAHHPTYGRILSAYIDTDYPALDAAPQVAAEIGAALASAHAAYAQAEAFERKMSNQPL